MIIKDRSLEDQFKYVTDWIKLDINKRGRYFGDLLEWMGLKTELEHYLYRNTNKKNVPDGFTKHVR